MTAKHSLQGVGIGQTWQNVTGSRAFNVTYQNTTGRPIAVKVNGSNFGGISIDLKVDTVSPPALISDHVTSSVSGVTTRISVSAIVPPNHYYRAESSQTLDRWVELR